MASLSRPPELSEVHVLKALSIFTGNANPKLAEEICRFVEIPLGNAQVTHFADGEIYVEINENVRGVNCFVVQPTCSPVNEAVMELLIMIDALRRASAGSIVAVIPYFGYARQDRKVRPRTPITSKLVADLISAAGADRVVSMDLHAGQIQGFFNIPFDHLFAMPVFIEELRRRGYGGEQSVVVSPDAGGVERARAYSKRLGASLAIIDKRRSGPGVSEVMNIIGDVKGKSAIIVDDIIDSAGTLANAARAVIDAGASSVSACGTHAVFSGQAVERLEGSPLHEVIVSNSIPLRPEAEACEKIQVKSVGRLLGEACKRIHHGDSISSLFI
jgi:ribose-phosphate pyrophosphokinase